MLKNVKIQKKLDLNFFYLLSILYKNLILFIVLSLIPIFIVLIAIYQTKDEYIYEINFTQNYIEFENQYIKCLINDNRPCRYDIYINKLIEDYEKNINFSIFKNILQIKGNDIENLKEIERFLRLSNEKLSKKIYQENLNKLKLINNIISDPKYVFKNNDYFTGRIFHYKDLINNFEKGLNLFNFNDTKLIKLPKFSKSFLIFLLIFCPIFSSGIIFIKENLNLIKKIK